MKLAGCVALTLIALLVDPFAELAPIAGGAGGMNLSLLAFVVLILSTSGAPTVWIAAGLGLIGDSLAGGTLGPQMASYALIAGIVSEIRPRRALSAIELIVYAASSGFCATLLPWTLRRFAETSALPEAAFLQQVVVDALRASVVVAALCIAGRALIRVAADRVLPGRGFFARRRSLG